MAKKLKGTKRLSGSKPPGASPASAHLQPTQRKRKSVPKNSHPASNLGRWLHPAKEGKLSAPRKIGVASVVKAIKSSKRGLINV